jgi:hypothetical protein
MHVWNNAELYFWFLPSYQSYYATIVIFSSLFMLLWMFIFIFKKGENMVNKTHYLK